MKFRAGDLVVNRNGAVRVVTSVSNVLNRMWVKPTTAGAAIMVDPDRWEIA
jgi:hypothetical protein